MTTEEKFFIKFKSKLHVAKMSLIVPASISILAMERPSLKNVNNGFNTKIYSYLETSGGQSYNLYLNVKFLNTSLNQISVAT